VNNTDTVCHQKTFAIIYFPGNALAIVAVLFLFLFGLLQSHQHHLLRPLLAEMHQHRRLLLGQVVQPGLEDGLLLFADRPGDALRLRPVPRRFCSLGFS
jgi:hypothetical protein